MSYTFAGFTYDGSSSLARSSLDQAATSNSFSPVNVCLLWLREFGALDDILEQQRNRHGADAAWDGGDRRRARLCGLVLDVAENLVPAFARGVVDVVVADVYDHGALLDPLALDELGLASADDHDVRLLDLVREPLGLGMARRDCRVALHEHEREWEPHKFAATDHHHVFASNANTVACQQLNAPRRSARLQVKPVDVLLWTNRFEQLFLLRLQVHGKRQLEQDAVHTGVRVQLLDESSNVMAPSISWMSAVMPTRVHAFFLSLTYVLEPESLPTSSSATFGATASEGTKAASSSSIALLHAFPSSTSAILFIYYQCLVRKCNINVKVNAHHTPNTRKHHFSQST
uniref:Uncharacterized protein n=1 Tax=Globisporangium ultimum (strain ATCC 200006 / CBS 805.95 / DAOM BR144) TaxID=431595 RepID=K3WR85_GLOUD